MQLEYEGNIIDRQKQLRDSELFMELSDQEQEETVGGFYFSMTALNISSYVGNKFEAASGSVSLSYSQDSSYTLSLFNIELIADNKGKRNHQLPYSPFVYFYRALLWAMGF